MEDSQGHREAEAGAKETAGGAHCSCKDGRHEFAAHGCHCPYDAAGEAQAPGGEACRNCGDTACAHHPHEHEHGHDHAHEHEEEAHGHDHEHGHSHEHEHAHGCEHGHDEHGGHHHHHHGLFHTHADTSDSRRLAGALALTCTTMLAEFVGGIVSGSLSLVSDAGHMLTDAAALLLSFLALKFARRPADGQRTFGYSRFEILSALVNAITLIVLALIIICEAVGRLREPQPIQAGIMLAVAAVGLAVNVASAFLLSDSHSLNVRGAFLHVLGDTLSSVGVIIAAAVAWKTGWTLLDPILSIAIALFIAFGAVRLLRQASHILLEGAPAHAPFGDVVQALLSVEGVTGVHDLHMWTLAQDHHAISAHIELKPGCTLEDHSRILTQARALLKTRFNLEHSTLQLEFSGH